MQTNKINGDNTIDVINGRKPDLAMVGLAAGGTENHKLEAAEVQIGFYAFVMVNLALLMLAVRRAIDLLQRQVREGHMRAEVLTDSHAPIYLRAMCALRIHSAKLRQRGGDFEVLAALVEQWFEHHYACLSLGLVPSGPLAGRVLLPCARKSPEAPGDTTRDAWMALVNGARPQGVGPKFWNLDKDRQDTAAGPLTKMVLATCGFGPNLKRGTLPKLIAPLTVDRFQDGHLARFPNGLPDCADTATSFWVEYSSGRYDFAGRDACPLGGSPQRSTKLLAA